MGKKTIPALCGAQMTSAYRGEKSLADSQGVFYLCRQRVANNLLDELQRATDNNRGLFSPLKYDALPSTLLQNFCRTLSIASIVMPFGKCDSLKLTCFTYAKSTRIPKPHPFKAFSLGRNLEENSNYPNLIIISFSDT